MIVGVTAALIAVLIGWPVSAGAAHGSTLELFVDCGASVPGDGTAFHPYDSLPVAVSAARDLASVGNKVIINILPGECAIPGQIEIDFPVEVRGSSAPILDGDGWPTGMVEPDTETVVYQSECTVVPEGMSPLVIVRPSAGEELGDISLSNLTLRGLAPCRVLQIQEVRDFTVADTIVEAASVGDILAQAGIFSVASRGLIARNYVHGMEGCGICIGAGTPGAPSRVTASDNRVQGCLGGGMLLSGSTFAVGGSSSLLLRADVDHNDLSNNVGTTPGYGIRVLTIDRDELADRGHVNASITDNRVDNNQVGVMIDAGFPYRDPNPDTGVCDPRSFTSQLNLRFRGNSVTGSLKRAAVVTFTRGQVFTNGNPLRRWQYLHGATYSIEDPDLTLLGPSHLFDHPLLDPFPPPGTVGTCDADQTNEALNNTLWYNAEEVQPQSP
jgi:hypothetical protein